MMRPKATWKASERRVAAIFGTVRRALSGGNSNSGGRDDAKHPRVYIECKYAKVHAVWTLWRQCLSHCHREKVKPKRRPVVALFEYYRQGCLLVIHNEDVMAVLAEIVEAQYPNSDIPSRIRSGNF